MTARLAPIQRLFFALAAVCCTLTAGLASHGEDFRVENKVFSGKDTEPTSQSTTIFFDGVVYDYLANPPEITVFDPARGQFILLNTSRRVKTELRTDEVASFAERLGAWAAKNPDPLLRFMSDPKFEEQSDDPAGEITLASPWLSYHVVGKPAGNPELARQYRQFSDWHARLNSLINPGALPPTARLRVNKALEERHLIPHETTLTLKRTEGLLPKRVTLRSQHEFVPRLAESDRRRVAQTVQFIAMFNAVSFNDYQKPKGVKP